MGRMFAGLMGFAAIAAVVLVPGTAAGATPAFDLKIRQGSEAIQLIRPTSKRRFSTDYLAPSPFAFTGRTPLEIWAHRPDPAVPLVVESISRETGGPVATPLDLAATMDQGLTDFIRVRFRDMAKGKVVREWDEAFCPSGYGEAKSSGTGRKDNRYAIYPGSFYPYGACGEEQADSLVWMMGSGSGTYHSASRQVDLPDGTYRLEMTLNPNRALPEKNLANNSLTQKFTLTSDRRQWRKMVFGPRTSASGGGEKASTVRSPIPVGSRQVTDRQIRPPGVSDIAGPPGALPDPAALPASKFEFREQGGKELVSFSSIVKNAGEAPIALFGRRSGAAGETMPGWQYLKGADGRLDRRDINGFVWDSRDTHFHWHYNRLATYELLDIDGKVLRRSAKIGFCFLPTTPLHLEPAPGPVGLGIPIGFDNEDLPVDCGRRDSKKVAMSLAAGWGDEYYQGIAGQSFDVSDLPAGSYRLRITVNPKGDLAEVASDNNVSERLFELGVKGGRRTLTVPQQGFISSEFYRLQKGLGSGRASTSAFRPTAAAAVGQSRLLCGLSRY